MTKKIIKIVSLGLIAGIVLIAGIAYFSGSYLIRSQIQKKAGISIGRTVDIRDLSMDLFKGNIIFSGITVHNSDDYDFPFIMEIENAFIDTQPLSILGDTVRITAVELGPVNIFLEQRLMKNNLLEMLAEMPARQDPTGPEQQKGKAVNIEQTTINDLTVNLKIIGDQEEPRSLRIRIDPIVLENLGSEEEINTGAVAARITAAIIAGVIKQTADELPAEVVRQIVSAVDDTINLGNLVLGEGREIIGEVGGQLFEGVRDIFNREKPDD